MITELERRLIDAFHEDAQRARLVHLDASWDDREGRSHLQLGDTRLEPDEQLVPVKEIYVSVDSPPTGETSNRRRLAIAAAAVVAVIGVAAIATNSPNSDDDVEPAPAVQPTVAPTTVAPRGETGVFEVTGPSGTYVTGVSGTYTVPDGWRNLGFGVIKGDPAFGVIFGNADDIYYTSVCLSVSIGPAVGPTVDDLVSAWANLPGVDATAARDVTIDGFDGKQIEFTVPDYDAGDCNGMFTRCGFSSGNRPQHCDSMLLEKDSKQSSSGGYGFFTSYSALPNQHEKIWILDVDGARLMIMAGSFPDTSPQDRAALDEIVASIRFG